MRESTIESHLKTIAEAMGWRSYKWVSPGLNGVPDQIVLACIPPEHMSTVAKYVRFVELKAPGEKARGQQQLRHAELRLLGFQVDVVDSKEGAGRVLGAMG